MCVHAASRRCFASAHKRTDLFGFKDGRDTQGDCDRHADMCTSLTHTHTHTDAEVCCGDKGEQHASEDAGKMGLTSLLAAADLYFTFSPVQVHMFQLRGDILLLHSGYR